MILKMIIGRGFRGVDSYVTGKPNARILATNMAGRTPRERAREIAGLRSARPDLGKAIGHLVLSHDPSLPDLSDPEWHRAIAMARAAHELRDAPYMAVAHDDSDHRHVHLFLTHSAGGWLGGLRLKQLFEEHGISERDRASARPAASAASDGRQEDRQSPKR